MAKVLFGASPVDMRNKVNGWVYSKNRYGGYIRTKVTPVNPQTTYQQAQRQALGSFSSQWRGLTEAQRKAWRDAAPSFPIIDVFGLPKILAGNVLFIRLNKNLTNAGGTTIDSPPLPVGIPDLYATAVTAAAGTPALSVTISEQTVPTGFALAVYATPCIGPGINFVKNRLRFIGVETATAGAVDILSDWQDRFGTLVEGQKVAVQVALISTTTGQKGVVSQASGIVAA